MDEMIILDRTSAHIAYFVAAGFLAVAVAFVNVISTRQWRARQRAEKHAARQGTAQNDTARKGSSSVGLRPLGWDAAYGGLLFWRVRAGERRRVFSWGALDLAVMIGLISAVGHVTR